jgi:L-ascorbate metabolism protein UlaG (beta-lactamase superfamily)
VPRLLTSSPVRFSLSATPRFIRYAGFSILTDPTFIPMHEQVSIGYGLHATRLTNPAMDIHALPPIDLVVLSHIHGDHFDQLAERELNKALPIVTTDEAAKGLAIAASAMRIR